MKRFTFCLGLFAFTACTSAPKVGNGVVYEKDQILSTAGEKAMPEWAERGELQPFVIKDGKVYSVGITTIRDGERPEAAARMAETNARSNISKAITNRLEYLFQGAEENYGFDSTHAKFIGAEASSLTTHSMEVGGQWWKRYVQMSESGERHIYYKVYALITESEADLRKAIFEASHDGEVKHKLSKGFQEQVNRQWSRFVESDPENRQPSASERKTEQSKSENR